MLTCKDFLHELSEYLDESIDAETRAKLDRHISGCPNCWVIADTTKKTIQIYKGMAAGSAVPAWYLKSGVDSMEEIPGAVAWAGFAYWKASAANVSIWRNRTARLGL